MENRKKVVTFFVFVTVFMNLRAKHQSKTKIKEIQSRSKNKTSL